MLFVDGLYLITLLYLFADVFQLWNTYKVQPKFDVTLFMFAHVFYLWNTYKMQPKFDVMLLLR